MSSWETVAVGASLSELDSVVGEMELKKGTKIRVVMNAPGYDWLFDVAGAELVFGAYVPDGCSMVDVWGESGKGIVEMEADPIWLVALLGFIKAHWLAIAIAGIVIATVVAFCYVIIKFVVALMENMPWILGGAVFLVGAYVFSRSRSPTRR